MSEAERPNYVSLAHDALFGDAIDAESGLTTCDVCDGIVEAAPGADDDTDQGPAIPGRAYYVWTRGDERRCEEAPICASCAVALGMSALARWEIEEEEG